MNQIGTTLRARRPGKVTDLKDLLPTLERWEEGHHASTHVERADQEGHRVGDGARRAGNTLETER